MNNPRSRTNEFRSVYGAAKARAGPSSAGGGKGKQQQLQQQGKAGSKSEVARLAGGIARDIQSTTEKLQKLAQRASRTALMAGGTRRRDASSVWLC
jgi:syntaxin 5